VKTILTGIDPSFGSVNGLKELEYQENVQRKKGQYSKHDFVLSPYARTESKKERLCLSELCQPVYFASVEIFNACLCGLTLNVA
jgi:hypothetical protein